MQTNLDGIVPRGATYTLAGPFATPLQTLVVKLRMIKSVALAILKLPLTVMDGDRVTINYTADIKRRKKNDNE